MAKIALYRWVSLMLQGRVDPIEALLAAIAPRQSRHSRAGSLHARGSPPSTRRVPSADTGSVASAVRTARAGIAEPLGVSSILHMLAEIVVEYWEPTLAAMVEEQFEPGVARRDCRLAFLHQPRAELVVRARRRLVQSVPVSQARGRVSGT